MEQIVLTFKCHLPEGLSEEEREQRAIPAEEVVSAIRAGKTIDIQNAVIRGPFTLRHVSAEREISIRSTKIEDPVDWSYATFKGILSLEGVTLEKEANLTGATVEKDFFLNKAIFRQDATFRYLKVVGALHGRTVIFEKKATFDRALLEKDIFFTDNAVFKQDAHFSRTRIKGDAHLDHATFQGKAYFLSAQIGGGATFTGAVFRRQGNFNGVRIEEAAFFTRAIFEGEADFVNARIGSGAEFTGAVFKGQACFDGVQIEARVFFKSAVFEGEVSFVGARVGRGAEFTGAVFKREASFDGVQIQGGVFYNSVIFEGAARFIGARIGGSAEFTSARFQESATFRASEFTMDTLLGGAAFAKHVSLQNAGFSTVFLGSPETVFQGKIDLRGCTYDPIHPTSAWSTLMKRLDPYDRQPFTQIEQTFRRAGEENLANEVYYERRLREAARITVYTQPHSWMSDRLLRLLTGYGVQLWRLPVAFSLILLLGTLIFHREGAVESKRDTQPPATVTQRWAQPHENWSESFWVALRLFLPVEIPAGENWNPSSKMICGVQTRWGILGMRFATFATLLKLVGWILVPLGVAGLAGVLKR